MATARRHEPASSSVLRSPALPVLLTLAAVVIGVAALLPLIQSSSATTTAGDVRSLEVERNDTRARLRALELEVAQMGSLTRIEQEAAARFKMGPPTAIHYIAVDAPAPEPRRVPSRYLPDQVGPPPDSPSLLEDIVDWMIP
jgi:cell division protein FtsL